jgi:hypothetical protein
MAELEDIPPTVYPDGSVIGSLDASGNLPENPELLHRPHAFALMHGDGGAKVAYGQLVYKIDVLTLDYVFLGSHGDHSYRNSGAGQDAIGRLLTVVPRIDTDDGDVMDPTIPNIYHQLDGYGDVYLNWEILLEEGSSDHVSKCWVSTTAGGQSEAGALSVSDGANDFDDRGSDAFGSYRVKLGTVNENDPISQLISSDVYWTIFGLKRTRS